MRSFRITKTEADSTTTEAYSTEASISPITPVQPLPPVVLDTREYALSYQAAQELELQYYDFMRSFGGYLRPYSLPWLAANYTQSHDRVVSLRNIRALALEQGNYAAAFALIDLLVQQDYSLMGLPASLFYHARSGQLSILECYALLRHMRNLNPLALTTLVFNFAVFVLNTGCAPYLKSRLTSSQNLTAAEQAYASLAKSYLALTATQHRKLSTTAYKQKLRESAYTLLLSMLGILKHALPSEANLSSSQSDAVLATILGYSLQLSGELNSVPKLFS